MWPVLYQPRLIIGLRSPQFSLFLETLLQEEVFGPTTIVIEVEDRDQLAAALHGLRGQLTATPIGEADELLGAFLWALYKIGRTLPAFSVHRRCAGIYRNLCTLQAVGQRLSC